MSALFKARRDNPAGWLQLGLFMMGMTGAAIYGQHQQYELWESLDHGVRATVLEPAHCEQVTAAYAYGNHPAYKLQVRYAYVVAGRSYLGTRFSRLKRTTFSDKEDCEYELIPTPTGQPLLVWVSRDDPAQSVLDPRRPSFMFESFALLLGLWCCVRYWTTRHRPLPEPPDPSAVMDPEIDLAVNLALSVIRSQGFAQQQAAQSQATLTAAQRLAQTQDKAVLRACPDWLLTQLQQWVDEHRQTGHLLLAWEGMEEDQSALIQSIQHHFKA